MSTVVTMKVTVCFGSVRVLVPCGSGELLVRDLVREATHRYKKATGQGPETWVGVRALRASSGGILDPDDRVRDVADDRETLTAECTSQPPPPPQRAAQADGASGSSAGTASPDMFRGGGGVGGSMRVPNTDSCVEVGAADLEDGSNGLQVRRGSEPSLHQDNLPPQMVQASDQTKRWSAAVVCRDDVRPPKLPPDPPPDKIPHHNPNHFQRQTNRLSMQFSGPGSGNWLDAAERIQTYGSKSLPRDARRDPLGQDMGLVNSHQAHRVEDMALVNSHQAHRVEDMMRWVTGVNDVTSVHTRHERPLDLLPEVGSRERAITSIEQPVSPSSKHSSGSTQAVAVTLVKGEKGLGFTITTRDNPTGGHCPIYIKNILPKGAAVTDGRLRAGDKLVSVNNISVGGLSQQQVVTLLRNTPTNCSVDIVVERPISPGQRSEPQHSPAKYTEKAIGSPNSLLQMEHPISKPVENGRVSSIVHAFNQHKGNPNKSNGSNNSRGRIGKSSSKDSLLNKDGSGDSLLQDALNSSTNSILGLRNRLILRLEVPVHDSEKAGLGISVKGKVTVAQDPQDLGIFIKSVLNGGAASRDGRLHTNDQLLSVNGVSLVGQPNSEAMETLRRALLQARPNATRSIELTIARRTESMDSLARWKDDTPPNGNDFTNNSSDNSSNNNFTNTVIYNHTDKENKPDPNSHPPTNQKDRSVDDIRNSKRHSSIVTINNNTSWVSNQSDDAKGYLERDDVVDNKRDSFEWSRLEGWNPVIDRLTGLRNESYYMATQPDGPAINGHANYRPSYGHVHMSRSPPTALPNVIIEEDYGTTRGSASACDSSSVECSSAGENNAFSRDAVGRRSMSEKRHAALDARATTTYKRIRHAKQEAPVGPALGMRKSSSLESLQTAVQEIQRNPPRGKEPIYARAQPPLKHWLTDDSHGPEMIRGSPQQSSLSHKKPSLLKSLSTMFRIGKPVKKPETEIYGRTQPGRSSEKALSREALERLRIDEPRVPLQSYSQKQQHRSSGSHSRHNSGDRSDKSDERRQQTHAPAHRAIPTRTGPQSMEGAWGPSGHYVNYDEIQQNLNIRREKLSEVQIGQMRRQVNMQRAKAEEESRRVVGSSNSNNNNGNTIVNSSATSAFQSQRSCRDAPAPRPQSNYYEYESAPPRRPGKLSHYH